MTWKEFGLAVLIILVVIGACVAAISVSENGLRADKQAYCQCLGHQPFINTKYHDGRCLVNVLSYEELDVTETIFIAQEYCR